MRLRSSIGLLPLLVVASLAQAQPADPACRPDGDCGGAQGSAPVGVGTAPVSAGTGLLERIVLGLGLSTFGELFPFSSERVPGSSKRQVSLLGGIRFSIGAHLPERVRLMGQIQIGYGSAGSGPESASRGLIEGAGLELALERFKWVKPFVRFTYHAVVFPISTSPEGTLAWWGFSVSAGARISIVELHLSIGRDLAGGISPGIGLGLGWMH